MGKRHATVLMGIVLTALSVCACNTETKAKEEEKLPSVTMPATATPDVTKAPEVTKEPTRLPEITEAPEELPEKEQPVQDTTETEAAEPIYGKMPLILIETEGGAGIMGDKEYTGCTISVVNCEEESTLKDAAAGIRLRGNSTQMFEKKPYRIKFEEKQQLLGLSEGAHKSWVLLAEYNDPSLLRNFITYELGNALEGISYTTDCRLVEVYLNGDYAGVYLLAEQTQVDGERIALDETGVTDGSVTDTGYLLELEADITRRREEGAEGEAWFAVTGYAEEGNGAMMMPMERSFGPDSAYYVIKSDARSKEQVSFIQDYMISVYDAIYADKSKEAIEALIDLPSAVDMYLVQLLGNDFDNNYSSMYVYKDAGGKLMFGAPWDFDFAYGNFNGFAEAEDTVYMYHLLRDLGEYDWFREMVAERFFEVFDGENGLLAKMEQTISEVTDLYAEEFSREYARWREQSAGFGGFGGFGGFTPPEGDFNWGENGFGGFGEFMPPEGGFDWGENGFGGFGEFTPPEGDFDWGENGFGGFGGFMPPEGDFDWGENGFGGFGEFTPPEGGFDWGGNGFGGFGGFGGMSFGGRYDTQKEAAEALLSWIKERTAWMRSYFGEAEKLA